MSHTCELTYAADSVFSRRKSWKNELNQTIYVFSTFIALSPLARRQKDLSAYKNFSDEALVWISIWSEAYSENSLLMVLKIFTIREFLSLFIVEKSEQIRRLFMSYTFMSTTAVTF